MSAVTSALKGIPRLTAEGGVVTGLVKLGGVFALGQQAGTCSPSAIVFGDVERERVNGRRWRGVDLEQ